MSNFGNKKTLAKNTMFLYLRMVFVLLITLYTSRVVLKALGFEDFGIYNVVGSVVIFCTFLRQALTNATYRYIAYEIGRGDNVQLNKVYSMAINSHILLAIILFVIMELVGSWFVGNHLVIPEGRMEAAKSVFHFSLVTFCLSVLQTPYTSNVIAHEKMDFYALSGIAEVILKLLAVVLLAYSPFDKLISYGLFLMIVAIFVFLLNYLYSTIRIKDTKYRLIWDPSIMKKFVAYSGWSMLVNGAEISAQQSISIFFNWFIGTIGNAALALANQVNAGLNMFVTNFCQAINPQIIKSYAAGERDYFMSLLFTASKMAYIMLFLVAIPVLANLHYVLDLWLGSYPEMTPAFVSIIIVYYAFDSFQTPLWHAVHATGYLKVHQSIIGAIKIMAIPIMYIVLKTTNNANYALAVWSLSAMICAVARTIYMKTLINLDLHKYLHEIVFKLLLLTILGCPIPLLMTRFMDNSFITLMTSSLISVIITLVLSYFIVLNKSEREFVRSLPLLKKIFS